MSHKDKNIFISHIHENDHKLGDLIGLLRRKGLQPRNYSITSDKPNNVRSEAKYQTPAQTPHRTVPDFGCLHHTGHSNEQVGQLGDRNCGQNGQTHRRRLGARGCRVPRTTSTGQIPPCNRGVERREHSASNQRPIE